MNGYVTVLKEYAEDEFTEKKSVFISYVKRVDDEDGAKRFISEIKQKHKDATHNVYAYILKDTGIARFSDDGEPSGTAGMPVLEVIKREGLTGVCVVVTRYFGGILLGAGGLTRAYGKAARDALSAAGVSAMGLWEQVQLECDYGLLERVKLEIAAVDGILDDVVYAARVTVTASLPGDGPQRLQQRLTELSAGSVTLQSLGQGLRPGPREEI